MNFFDYVQLIQAGWDPAPPDGDWPRTRKALLQLATANRGAAQIAEAVRLEDYVTKTDKLYNYGESVNGTME